MNITIGITTITEGTRLTIATIIINIAITTIDNCKITAGCFLSDKTDMYSGSVLTHGVTDREGPGSTQYTVR